MIEEQWRPIPWCPEVYEVSDQGNVRRIGSKKPLRQKMMGSKRDYPCVVLSVRGKPITKSIHQLVAEAFIGPRPDGMEVNHKDCCKSNNAASNLEYVTPSGNMKHAHRNGRTRLPRPKITNEIAASIRNDRFSGMTYAELVQKYKLSRTHISGIVNYMFWSSDEERAEKAEQIAEQKRIAKHLGAEIGKRKISHEKRVLNGLAAAKKRWGYIPPQERQH